VRICCSSPHCLSRYAKSAAVSFACGGRNDVEHIIYSLYPVIPQTANLNANMKPGFSAACAASAVHCVLVDLEPLFKGQHFASDRTHADNAGGTIIGDAWWKAMKENCIGQ
jgi:hypothetical protein